MEVPPIGDNNKALIQKFRGRLHDFFSSHPALSSVVSSLTFASTISWRGVPSLFLIFNKGLRRREEELTRTKQLRKSMTIAFTSIMTIFIIERIDEKTGTTSMIPLVVAGILSILYWRFFDDLHPYAVVQFVPCIVIPLMAILMPPMYTHSSYWLWDAGFYLLAKAEEAEDKVIYKWTHHIISAAMIPVFLTLMLAKRSIETERKTLLQTWQIYWIKIKESRFERERMECEYSVVSTSE